MQRLLNKVAIITGGTGGIGLATARLFVAEGARLALIDLDRAALARAAAELGAAHVLAVPADVSEAAAVAGYVEATLARFGRVDVFFNNAGIEGAIAPIVEYPIEDFDRVMAVNVRGVWLGLKYVIPAMAKSGGGSIVITSSLAGLRGMPKLSAYVGAKHAVVGIMKAAALECARQNIRVNTINPAPIATRMMESIEQGYAGSANSGIKSKLEQAVPMRRYGEPAEVARLALFLASDDAAYITGTTYSIDGGMTAA
jgi:NAD(P)-dependent dehydrogenase (short-subunit alcohol dehydrogenase family)